ncbi:hypothetical protein [Amycolatopsis regifaucium]|uniref:Uncharacterized protein n=1 Tax=Amycolatopsis regifaucium TaxID=546365 RepID=A0A154MSQ8_9PSEU|nr:hypothetical protein [Amycolatopsis regifaucium]KZB87292.1 hypothetical protein AVL48_21790 [Amycolatopsis regifaucium]OKA08126.1 hypothetical protein ATP06_0212550 [Amycolatopsis regifaucium]SFI40467.1 hypothetical protein SAMN04489731_110173 [Amycolatopsis regifaucium]
MPDPWGPRWGFLFLYFLAFAGHWIFRDWDDTATIGAIVGFVATLVLVFVPGLPHWVHGDLPGETSSPRFRQWWSALRFTIRRREGVLDVVLGPWSWITATLEPGADTARGWAVLDGHPAKFVIENCPGELAESLREHRRMWVVGDAHYGDVLVCGDGGREFTTAAIRFR